MGHRAGAGLVAATLLALMLVGCNGAERQRREQAARERAAAERQLDGLVSRCRRQQGAVSEQVRAFSSSSAASKKLSKFCTAPVSGGSSTDW